MTVTSLPKAPVHLGEFEPDIAAPDDHQMARQKSTAIIELFVRYATCPRPGQLATTARPPNIDEDPLRGQQSLADLYLVRRDEASVAPVDRAILQPLRPSSTPTRDCSEIASFLALTRAMSARTGPSITTRKIGGAARHMDRIGTGNQGLCRNAAGIDASAAERIALDDGDGRVRRGAPSGQRGGPPARCR
jgi:hypothetical protein